MKICARLACALLSVCLVGSELASAAPPKNQVAKSSGVEESLVELLPARARAAVIVRKNSIAPARDMMSTDTEMMNELRPYLLRTLGIDPTRIEGIAAFTLDVSKASFTGAVILRIPSQAGSLKLPTAGDAGGTPMYKLDKMFAALIKAGIVIGDEAEVRAAVAVDRGREPSLPKDVGLGKLLAPGNNDIDFVIAVGPGALPPDKTMGVEDAVLVYLNGARTLELALHGDPARLGALKGMAQGGVQMGLAALAQEKDKAVATNDPLKGATAISTYYQAKKLAAELDPKLEGNALKLRYHFPELSANGTAMYVAVAGVLAAVAVPSFTKYMQKSKSAEAKTNLARLATSLRSVVAEGGKGVQSIKATEWTPARGCCGQTDNKCVVDPGAWKGTWQALTFSVDDPSRYQYRVRTEGKGKQVRYILEARGDLDCDNTFSSYKRTFSADGGEIGELQIENETE